MHSNLVFTPPWELNFDFPSKKPTFRTIIQSPVSGRGEIRASLQPFPIWEIEYSLQYGRGAEQIPNSVYQYMLGFYLAMGGQASDFLYWDPNDNTVANNFVAQADGNTSLFQLMRAIGQGTDIVQNPGFDPDITIQVDEAPNTNWTRGVNGLIQFNSNLPAGSVITWSGTYYYRVRFDDDGLDFDQMMDKIWELKSLKLKSVIL
jgi:hypothetical protein